MAVELTADAGALQDRADAATKALAAPSLPAGQTPASLTGLAAGYLAAREAIVVRLGVLNAALKVATTTLQSEA